MNDDDRTRLGPLQWNRTIIEPLPEAKVLSTRVDTPESVAFREKLRAFIEEELLSAALESTEKNPNGRKIKVHISIDDSES